MMTGSQKRIVGIPLLHEAVVSRTVTWRDSGMV